MTVQPPRPTVHNIPQLEIPADIKSEYINLVRISHSPMDLFFDFAELLPGGPARVRSRVVMSPLGAKLLLRALAENINKYETSFGEIKIPGDTSLADYLFRPPQPPQPPQSSPPPDHPQPE